MKKTGKRRIGTLPLGRSYGHGVSIRWSPVNRAWMVLWKDQVLRVTPNHDEAHDVARDLVKDVKG